MTLFIVPFLLLVWLSGARAEPRGFVWPVSGPIAKGFEKPTGPYGEGGHQGVDIAAAPGTAVRAAQDGTVSWVGELPRGRFVSVTHAGGVRTTYLDLDSIGVTRGERVHRGQVIATVSGSLDSSSPGAHLHFDTYLNGHPVDPCLLFNGLDAGSFVRLCPVERRGGQGDGATSRSDARAGLSTQQPRSTGIAPPAVRDPRAGGPGLVKQGLGALWRGLGKAGGAVARFAKWAWSNRYVKAVTAGLAAAVVVVIGVVIAFALLPISALVATIAAVAGTLACIGMAIYYAATSGADFAFATCFLKSLSAGGIAAAGVISWGVLSGSVAAGWAEVGLAGTLKAAVWNGMFSALFDTGISYLFTGQFSFKRALVAFFVGALSGGVGKILREGMFTERIMGLLSVTSAGNQAGVLSLTQSASVIFRETVVRLEGLLVLGKELALTFGGKVAYIAFSGSLTAGLNVLTCALTHRPITLSGILASFMAGMAMGGIALSFGGHGVDGFLSRFSVFRKGFGTTLRRFAAKIVNKSISRSLKNSFETGFRKVIKEEEASR